MGPLGSPLGNNWSQLRCTIISDIEHPNIWIVSSYSKVKKLQIVELMLEVPAMEERLKLVHSYLSNCKLLSVCPFFFSEYYLPPARAPSPISASNQRKTSFC